MERPELAERAWRVDERAVHEDEDRSPARRGRHLVDLAAAALQPGQLFRRQLVYAGLDPVIELLRHGGGGELRRLVLGSARDDLERVHPDFAEEVAHAAARRR